MSHPSSGRQTGIAGQAGPETLVVWREVLDSANETLRRMAGTTEDDFLQIGSDVQGFYQRSTDITRMANQLVEIVSGESVTSLTGRLQQMILDMEVYLTGSRTRSSDSCAILERVQELLEQLSEPLLVFQKMNKTLRMLSISTKIESSRLGEMGSGFVNLALDVEKLSHQVNEKSAAILAHRQLLSGMIATDLTSVRSAEIAQDAQVKLSLQETHSSLQALVALNERCTGFGVTVSCNSAEVSDNISEIVSSVQMHDMTRQQFEHIEEALRRLSQELRAGDGATEDERLRALIVESGDVCELQEAQLRFAAAALHTAVCTILENLREVARKQSQMAHETRNVTGVTDSGGSSFVDDISREMTAVTAVLTSCARADRNMCGTMKKVARTVGEIATYVTDIEAIGSEINLIALNSLIRAAHTGPEGAVLGVLAEAIKRLSDEAVRQTDSVARNLTTIKSITERLSVDSDGDEEQLVTQVTSMQDELDSMLRTLGGMNGELFSVLSELGGRVASLTADVEQVAAGISVHERAKGMAERVLANLEQIVLLARTIEPASSEFKQNLSYMEQRYTMESERQIHEALARKRGGQPAALVQVAAGDGSDSDSEFGANVDLF